VERDTVHPCFYIVDCGRGDTPTSTRKGKVGRKGNQRKRIVIWKGTKRNIFWRGRKLARKNGRRTKICFSRVKADNG
jgi:hypothetical protein